MKADPSAQFYYEAMLARDPRFDGKFFVGVKTTGIYCRPICPAKPKRKNVEFFKNHLSAEKAGYRPCMRCRPESAPTSPAWIGKSAIVNRAIRKLNQSSCFDLDENEFAKSFGVSARHLRRVFNEEIGKTPKQLSFENRLNLARKLLVETCMPVSQVAFASGFSSIRRFNDSFKERFKKIPTEIRRQKSFTKVGLMITLPYRPPFDFEGLMHFYQSHQLGNLEWFEEGKMTRVIELSGKVGTVILSNDQKNSQILVEIDFEDTTQIPVILSKVRSLLDLDSDPVLIANKVEQDPKLTAILKKHPGIRLPSGWSEFETAISTILGQFVSVERGRTLVGDLIQMLGRSSGLKKDGKPILLFPTPQQIATGNLDALKTTGARKQTLKDFSRAVAEEQISLESTQDVNDFIKSVSTVKGIGAWTANYMALKVLRNTDSFPATDLIIARTLEFHPIEVIEKMSPWRGYVAALLWREYAGVLKKEKKVVSKKISKRR